MGINIEPPLFPVNGGHCGQWGIKNPAVNTLNTTKKSTPIHTGTKYHPFHIQPFPVISINIVPEEGLGHRETMPIPSAVDGMPGTVGIRQEYTDFTCRSVIHCPILCDEDHGMMSPVRMVK